MGVRGQFRPSLVIAVTAHCLCPPRTAHFLNRGRQPALLNQTPEIHFNQLDLCAALV
jgi:hypothetical protein